MGHSMADFTFRMRGDPALERCPLLMDEQLLIGWDNLLRGKFSKQWKIQQREYITRRKLKKSIQG